MKWIGALVTRLTGCLYKIAVLLLLLLLLQEIAFRPCLSVHDRTYFFIVSFSVADVLQEPSPRGQYPSSSSKIDEGVLLGSDLTKNNTTTAIAKKYSLPPRARKDVSQVEARARTRSVDNELQDAYDNPGISMETSDDASSFTRKTLSLTNRIESPFYTEPMTKDPGHPLPSIKARYGKARKDPNANKEEVPDANANGLPAVKGDLERRGSIVRVSKSRTGETCFQVHTPVEFKKKESSEEINV